MIDTQIIENLFKLSRIKPFDALTESELLIISQHVKPRSYDAGDQLIKTGDVSDLLFILTDGGISDGENRTQDIFDAPSVLFGSPVRRDYVAGPDGLQVLCLSKPHLFTIVFSVPLFMALAGLNGALLYFQERSESASALREQALSAAVTAAEFMSSMENPANIFSDASRLQSIADAASHIQDLDGFYFVDGGRNVSTLSSASNSWTFDDLLRPSEPTVTQITPGPSTPPYVIALAPVGIDSFVAVRLNAAPMVAKLATLRSHIFIIVCISGIIGALLAWYVAHRIVSELAMNQQAITALEAGNTAEMPAVDKVFAIREASELADAVRLMDASQRAAANRLNLETAHQDRERTHDGSVVTYRETVFGPLSKNIVGADIAVRLVGDATAGCFFVVRSTKDRAIIVTGLCDAEESANALALALAARRYLNNNIFNGDLDECLELARTAFNIRELEYAEWHADNPMTAGGRLIAITDAEKRQKAERYFATDPNATPADILEGIETLIKPAGVFAAIRRGDTRAQNDHAEGEEEGSTRSLLLN